MKDGKSAWHCRNGKVGRGSGIDYEKCKLEPVKECAAHFGSRYKFAHGSYWLDGKIILVGLLIQKMREEKYALLAERKTT